MPKHLKTEEMGGFAMAELLVYDMTTSGTVAAELRKLLVKFSRACADVAAYADEKRQYNSRHLSAVFRDDLQAKYLLPSGLADCACRRVGHDFTRLNPNAVRRERRDNMPSYYGNTWILYSGETASVGMRAVKPWCTDYPFVLSLSVLKKRGKVKGKDEPQRLKDIPIDLSPAPMPAGEMWHNKEIRLYSDDDGRKWSLLVAVGLTDDVEDEAEDDPTQNPDYQEPDYTPLEEIGE
jgi:hypothetical protein